MLAVDSLSFVLLVVHTLHVSDDDLLRNTKYQLAKDNPTFVRTFRRFNELFRRVGRVAAMY